jgi:DnaJ like chaperone protein
VWGKVIGGAAAGSPWAVPSGPWSAPPSATPPSSGGLLRGLGASSRASRCPLGDATRHIRPPARSASRRDQVFAVAVVLLAAKLSRADGPIVRAEIDAFKRCFRIPQEAVRDIGRLYDRRPGDLSELTTSPIAAAELGRAFADNRGMLGRPPSSPSPAPAARSTAPRSASCARPGSASRSTKPPGCAPATAATARR